MSARTDDSANILSAVQAAAQDYLTRGLPVIPLKGKVPWNSTTDKPLGEWQKLQIDAVDVADHFNGETTGVGLVLTGHADFDLDSPVAQYIGDRILPPTARFGRGNKVTHVCFECVDEYFADFNLPHGKIELRADSGHQTMFPPSVHPDGEVVEWKNDLEPRSMPLDDLKREFTVLGIACIFCEFYAKNDRDNLLTILSHVLHKYLNMDADDIQSICDAIMDFHGDNGTQDARNRRHKAVQTVKGLQKGVKKPGLNELKKIIGEKWQGVVCELLDVGEQDEWPDPVDIFADAAPRRLEPLPRDFLPGPYGKLASSIADVVQCPYEIPFGGLVTTVLANSGKRLTIRVKQNDPWRVPSLMWGLIICPSGTRKSSGMDLAVKPYQWVQAALMREWLVVKEIIDDWPDDDEDEEPDLPPEPVLITNKTTAEQLGVDMQENAPLLLLDEADSLVRGMNQYKGGRGDDRSLFLKGWNGTQPHSIRLRSGPIWIEHAYISIFGLTQPAVAKEFLRTEHGLESGWSARHGLLLYPDDMQRTASDTVMNDWANRRVFMNLLALRDLYGEIVATPEATDAFLKWEQKNINQVLQLDDPLRGHFDKFNSYVVQLAAARTLMKLTLKTDKDGEIIKTKNDCPIPLINEAQRKRWDEVAIEVPELQLIPTPYSGDTEPDIEADDVEFAADIVERCLKDHARKVYVSMTDDPGAEIARKLVPWFSSLVEAGEKRVKRAEILRRYKLKDDARRYEHVIRYLVRCDILRPTKRGYDRNPQDAGSFEINPKVRKVCDGV